MYIHTISEAYAGQCIYIYIGLFYTHIGLFYTHIGLFYTYDQRNIRRTTRSTTLVRLSAYTYIGLFYTHK